MYRVPRHNLHLYVPKELYNAVQVLAQQLGQSVTQVIIDALTLYTQEKTTHDARHSRPRDR